MTSSQIITQNPLSTVFAQYNNCPQHRGIVLSLCATLQIITLLCPSSLVWNSLGDEKSSSFLCGSPLDLLPCAPSSLPMPQGPQNMQVNVLYIYLLLSKSQEWLGMCINTCTCMTNGKEN